jgi:hypothetical protein
LLVLGKVVVIQCKLRSGDQRVITVEKALAAYKRMGASFTLGEVADVLRDAAQLDAFERLMAIADDAFVAAVRGFYARVNPTLAEEAASICARYARADLLSKLLNRYKALPGHADVAGGVAASATASRQQQPTESQSYRRHQAQLAARAAEKAASRRRGNQPSFNATSRDTLDALRALCTPPGAQPENVTVDFVLLVAETQSAAAERLPAAEALAKLRTSHNCYLCSVPVDAPPDATARSLLDPVLMRRFPHDCAPSVPTDVNVADADADD